MNLKKQIFYKYLAIFWDPENRSLLNGKFPTIINKVISIFFLQFMNWLDEVQRRILGIQGGR